MRACPAGLPVKAHALCALPGFSTSGFGRRSKRDTGAKASDMIELIERMKQRLIEFSYVKRASVSHGVGMPVLHRDLGV